MLLQFQTNSTKLKMKLSELQFSPLKALRSSFLQKKKRNHFFFQILEYIAGCANQWVILKKVAFIFLKHLIAFH